MNKKIHRFLRQNIEDLWKKLADQNSAYRHQASANLHLFAAPTHLAYFNMCFENSAAECVPGAQAAANFFRTQALKHVSESFFLRVQENPDVASLNTQSDALRQTCFWPLDQGALAKKGFFNKAFLQGCDFYVRATKNDAEACTFFYTSMAQAFAITFDEARSLLARFCKIGTLYVAQQKGVQNLLDPNAFCGHVLIVHDAHKRAAGYMLSGSLDVQKALLGAAMQDASDVGCLGFLFPFNPLCENPVLKKDPVTEDKMLGEKSAAPNVGTFDLYPNPFVDEKVWQGVEYSGLYTAKKHRAA